MLRGRGRASSIISPRIKSGGAAARAVLPAYLTLLLLMGLWPFNFLPANKVSWIAGRPGLRFGQHGIVYGTALSGDSLPGGPAPRATTIEAILVPAEEPASSLPYILTFNDRSGRSVLAVGHWRRSLIIRAAVPGHDLSSRHVETGARDAFRKRIPVHVAIVAREDVTQVYVDGAMVTESRVAVARESVVSPGMIVLGNAPDGKKAWTGDILFLAIYDRALSGHEVAARHADPFRSPIPGSASSVPPVLSFSFREGAGGFAGSEGRSPMRLSIPQRFDPPAKRILKSPLDENLRTPAMLADIVVNIVGFIPLGVLLAASRKTPIPRWRAADVLGVASWGGGISLGIEILQIYLPSRYSSLTDFAMNVGGTLIGAGLLGHARRRQGPHGRSQR